MSPRLDALAFWGSARDPVVIGVAVAVVGAAAIAYVARRVWLARAERRR